jgi:hypothetical protein
MMILLITLVSLAWPASGFSVTTPFRHHCGACSPRGRNRLQAQVSYDEIADIGYDVSVAKPMGVVFGENPDPWNGLVVDDIELGQNGGVAGLRVGDQLVSINEQVVVGGSFDDVMTILREGPPVLNLQMYRGGVRALYVILQNRAGDNPLGQDVEMDEEEVIMDENYVSPVVIDVSQYNDDPLSVGDFVNAFKNLGKMLTEGEEGDAPAPAKKQGETKKAGGFFGMFQQETIQLDGDDATGTGLSKR